MKKLLLILTITLIPWIASAQVATATPTETPTSTPTNTPTPTPVVRSNPAAAGVTIGSTSTFVVSSAALKASTGIIITNDSDEAMYLNIYGSPAVMNTGIRLNANGGSISFNRNIDHMPYGGIYAICTSGSKKLLVTLW